MKIEVAVYSDKGIRDIAVSHKGEKLIWDAKTYIKTNQSVVKVDGEKTDLIFKEINGYWKTLSADRQQAIWECYKDIHEILITHFDALAILQKLQIKVKALYDLMPLDELRHWVQYYGDVRIPSNLTEQYDPTGPYLRERTYLRSDYHDLVVLSVACRPMVPVWGEYITRTKSERGTAHKETAAIKLLFKSELASCEPMERLRTYIESSVEHSPQKGPGFAAILRGLGTSELPGWLLASTIVRRIAIVPVSALDDNSSIIANVNNYVSHALRSIDRRFGGHVSEKKIAADERGEDPNVSLAEMYKVKQDIPDGDKVVLNVYTENPIEMAIAVDSEVDLSKVEICLEQLGKLEKFPISDHQIVLVQWVMASCLPCRGIQLLDKPSLLRTLCVTQALLWDWQFFDLATLATAEEKVAEPDMMISTQDYRSRIPKELMDRLIELFPYQYKARGKNQSVRQTNVASRAVDAYCDLITSNDWIPHAPEALLALSSKEPSQRTMPVPPDIRSQVAMLLIRLNETSASFV